MKKITSSKFQFRKIRTNFEEYDLLSPTEINHLVVVMVTDNHISHNPHERHTFYCRLQQNTTIRHYALLDDFYIDAIRIDPTFFIHDCLDTIFQRRKRDYS